MEIRTIRKLFNVIVMVFISLQAYGQDLGAIVPEAAAVRHGVLKNGMTYYICKTKGTEKGQFYIIQPTGSLVEQKGEYGLAHFVEHLLFCGTKHYEKRKIIEQIRKLGSEFGRDMNAGTGFESTIYELENIPLWNDSVSTECLLMLRDMMYYATLSDSDIKTERNVIVEESLSRNIEDELLNNTPYARPIIGDTATILHCSPQTIRNFYHRWYQPQMQAVVAIGPFNPDSIYAKIRDIFESVPAGSSTIPERAVIPPFTEPRIVIQRSNVSKGNTDVRFYIRQQMPADSSRKTVGGYLPSCAVNALCYSFSQTFQRAKDLGMNCLVSYPTDIDNASVLNFKTWDAKQDPKEVLYKFMKTIKDIVCSGFPDEIINKYNTDNADSTEIKDTLIWKPANSVLDDDDLYSILKKCTSNFLYGEHVVNSDTETQVDTYLKNNCDFGKLYKTFQSLYHDTNQTLVLLVPKDCKITKEDVLKIITEVNNSDPKPIILAAREKTRKEIKDSLIDAVNPTPGKIISDKMIEGGKVRKMLLSNGVTVLLHQLDSLELKNMCKKDEPKHGIINAYREGGSSTVDRDKSFGFDCILSDGIEENVSILQTNGLFYDRFWNEYFNEDERSYKHLYYELTNYELDSEDSVRIAKCWKKNWISRKDENTKKLIRTYFVPRYPSEETEHDSIMTTDDFKGIREAWKEYKSNYNGMFVAIDCAASQDSIIPLIVKYIGGLPCKAEPMKMIDRKEYYWIDRDSVSVDTMSDLKQDVLTLILFQEKKFSFTAENFILNKALESVLNTAVLNLIRLQNGDIYAPAVFATIERLPVANQSFCIQLTCAPGKSYKIEHELKRLIHDMTYGDAITQTMVDDFIKSLYASGGYGTNSLAYKALQEIENKGEVVDTRAMNLEKVITVKAVRKVLRSLQEHGHFYEYKLVSK